MGGVTLERRREIGLGLAVLDAVREPGEVLTQTDIAEVCGCTSAAIQQIEAKALRKLRRAAERLEQPER